MTNQVLVIWVVVIAMVSILGSLGIVYAGKLSLRKAELGKQIDLENAKNNHALISQTNKYSNDLNMLNKKHDFEKQILELKQQILEIEARIEND